MWLRQAPPPAASSLQPLPFPVSHLSRLAYDSSVQSHLDCRSWNRFVSTQADRRQVPWLDRCAVACLSWGCAVSVDVGCWLPRQRPSCVCWQIAWKAKDHGVLSSLLKKKKKKTAKAKQKKVSASTNMAQIFTGGRSVFFFAEIFLHVHANPVCQPQLFKRR